MADKIFLGTSKDNDALYLEKHKFDCGWYWGFGYIGNKNLHMHIESLIKHPAGYNPNWTDVSAQFNRTWITQKQWWILRDLFLTAYALKEAAAAYRHGGGQTQDAAPYRVTSTERADMINKDLETVLDNIWQYLTEVHAARPREG